jgi:hypothetical protein
MQPAEMSLAQLATHFNSLPGVKPVNRFPDRKTALRRIEAATPKVAAKPAAEPEPQPAAKPPTSGPRPPRPGSKRADFTAKLLSPEGVSLQYASRHYHWSKVDVGSVLLILWKRYGIVSERKDDVFYGKRK